MAVAMLKWHWRTDTPLTFASNCNIFCFQFYLNLFRKQNWCVLLDIVMFVPVMTLACNQKCLIFVDVIFVIISSPRCVNSIIQLCAAVQLQVTLSTAAAEDPSAFILITKVFRSSQDFASKLSLHQIDEQQFTISH